MCLVMLCFTNCLPNALLIGAKAAKAAKLVTKRILTMAMLMYDGMQMVKLLGKACHL